MLFLEQCKGAKIFIKLPELAKPSVEEKKALKRTLKKQSSETSTTKAKKKCAKICKLLSSIDPANLCESSSCQCCKETKNVINGSTLSDYHVSPEAIRILSSTISDCMKPCHYINSILNEITTMFAQIDGGIGSFEASTSSSTPVVIPTTSENLINLDTPQQDEKVEKIPEVVEEIVEKVKLNEVEASVPVIEVSSDEKIETIVIDPSTSSQQTVSEVADNIIDVDESDKPLSKAVSIETLSSVEICGSNSNIDEDSREWTILDAMNDNESDEKSDDEPFFEVNQENIEEQIDLTQSEQQVQTDADKKDNLEVSNKFPSVEQNILKPEDISLTSATSKSLDDTPQPIEAVVTIEQNANETMNSSIAITSEAVKSITNEPLSTINLTMNGVEIKIPSTSAEVTQPFPKFDTSVIYEPGKFSPETKSFGVVSFNGKSSDSSSVTSSSSTTSNEVPKVTNYDPNFRYHHNDKINKSIHSMIQMGYDNEGEWLSQLMINLGGDVAEAINFLAPNGK
jgi:hypothetical protein